MSCIIKFNNGKEHLREIETTENFMVFRGFDSEITCFEVAVQFSDIAMVCSGYWYKN